MRTRTSLPRVFALATSTTLALVAACGGEGDLTPAPVRTYPTGPVELRVDTDGITHVYGATDADAMFGAGYAMARDRLFQMEINRRRAQGRMSELFGAARRKDDEGARAFDFARLGAADVARARRERPEDAALLDAWCAGVNRRIAEVRAGTAPRPYGLGTGPEELDFVPDDWTPEHTAAVGKTLGFGMSSSLDAEILATALLRLAPEFVARYPLVLPAFDAFPLALPKALPPARALPPWVAPAPGPGLDGLRVPLRALADPYASNNWAVAGDRTDDGRPLLAGDPHQGLSSPARLWPVHMSSVAGGGAFDVVGFAFAGTPGVQLGHNGRVGWTATTNFADVMDMWGVDTNDDETAVFFGGATYPIVRREETLCVRRPGGRYGECDPESITLRDVPGHGILLPKSVLPILPALLTDADEILFAWTGFDATLEASAYLAMDRATSLDAWEQAVDLLSVGAQNFVAADAKSIAYRVSARVPDRGTPGSHPMPWRILPGDDARTLWTRGDLSRDRLPRQRDPASGFLATANTDPFGFTADGDVENDPFYYGAFYANGMRLFRIQQALGERLATGKKVSRADMEELQRDVKSPMADVLVPRLTQAAAAVKTDPGLAQWSGRADLMTLAGRLAAWDRRLDRSSGDAVAFTALMWFAAKRAVETRMPGLLVEAIAEKSPPYLVGVLRNIVDGRIDAAADFLPEGVNGLLLHALDDTAAWLMARFGTLDTTHFALGDVLAAEFPTPFGGRLDVGRSPIGGGVDTIDVAPAPFFQRTDGALAARHDLTCVEMALYRMVIGFDDDGVPRATYDLARGASEQPDDRHFGDLHARWLDAQHTTLHFRRAEVEAATESTVVLR